MNRHNVNMAMALKNGAVQWRTKRSDNYTELSHLMVDTLTRFHGQPTGRETLSEALRLRQQPR